MISLKASMTCRSKSYVCLAMRSAAFIKFLPARGAQCRSQDRRLTIIAHSMGQRDAGIPLGEALASSRRVFALDMPWQNTISGDIGTMVYRSPQRSPGELRRAMMKAECHVHPLLWTDGHAAW